MSIENPLLQLGVPKAVLVRAVATDDAAMVLQIAEANYKTLAKQFHPDKPGGDADYMSALGDAIDELRDPDALDFYLDELVGSSDLAGAKREQRARVDAKHDTRSLEQLAEMCEYISQYDAVGIKKPISFFTATEERAIVVNVEGAAKGLVSVYSDTELVIEDPDFVKYSKKQWLVKVPDEGNRKEWFDLKAPSSQTPIKVVGYVLLKSSRGLAKESTHAALSAGAKQSKNLLWTRAHESWFLQSIHFGELPEVEEEFALVLFQSGTRKNAHGEWVHHRGTFTITPRVLKTAAITAEKSPTN